MFFFTFIILFLLFLHVNSKYIFVMTHFRHGARAPQRFYNKKEYLDYALEHWDTPGELTASGQRMHYLLGIRNRYRYIIDENFLSEKFDPHEILIYSSCLNRTINSAASQLQGLYPQYVQKGETLFDNQTDYSYPKANINKIIIDEQLKLLGNYSLPNSMILAPIRMINNNEKKMRLYDTGKCKDKTLEIKNENEKTLQILKDKIEDFKNKYSEKLKIFYEKDDNYDLSFIDNFCDGFISAYNERKDMKLLKAGFNDTDLKDFCFDFQVKNFRDWILGDKEHSLAHLESSKLMSEFIYYMDKRIKNDINQNKDPNNDVDKNLDDYSNPKMLMISGHDTTISCFEIFLGVAFDQNLTEFYRYPEFASQISFEVVPKDENTKGTKEDDYSVKYYFDDKLVLTIPVPEFKKKVEKQIWNDEKINNFCGYSNENGESNKDNDNSLKIYLIIFISSTVLFLISTIVLFIKLKKSNKPPSRIYESLVPNIDEKN